MARSDVEAYTVCIDPSYGTYVEQQMAVVNGDATAAVDWEVIFHAMREDVSKYPAQFIAYRVFVAAIGTLHPMLGELIDPHVLAITLVEESDAPALVHAALEEMADDIGRFGERDTPFVLLGALIAARRSARPHEVLADLALRVVPPGETLSWKKMKKPMRERWERAIAGAALDLQLFPA